MTAIEETARHASMRRTLRTVIVAAALLATTAASCDDNANLPGGEAVQNGGTGVLTYEGTIVGRIVEFPDGSKVRCAVSANGGITCDWPERDR